MGKNKKAQTYQLYFIDDFGNRISDIHKIIADKEDIEATNRQYRVNFCLKEHQFNKNDDYYLIIENENGEEISRIKYEIDIVFQLRISVFRRRKMEVILLIILFL